MKQISVLDDKGHMEHYPSMAAFLETLTPGDLTTALALMLEVDREKLSNGIIAVQYEAMVVNNELTGDLDE